jgi:NAD(P)H-hydrate epimerase
MKVVTAAEMRNIDRITIEEYGMPGLVLMERAGLSVASRIKELFGRKKVIVAAGYGNNGGDGMAASRHLHNEGWDVLVFVAAGQDKLTGDALSQYKAAVSCGVHILPLENMSAGSSSFVSSHSIVVDALLGTGISKDVRGVFSDTINHINSLSIPVVSVDIPSGISSDNGQIMGNAVKADYTVTFGLPKRGHFLFPGSEYTGKLFVEDIGFPSQLLESGKLKTEIIGNKYISKLIPERHRYSHKGTYGHVLIVAGSKGHTGAALMAAKACMKAGAGLVTIGVPESLMNIVQSRVTEEMTLSLPDSGNGSLSSDAAAVILDFLNSNADVLAIGPGIGVNSDTIHIVKTIILKSGKITVIDADGINSIKGDRKVLRKARGPVILTPHPGEMAGLLYNKPALKSRRSHDTGMKNINDKRSLIINIEKDRINSALSFAQDTGTLVVLKGAPSVIAGPDGRVFINSTGNPGMATAGAGDVLTGIISALSGQGMNAYQATAAGVYLHGAAGDFAATKLGEYSLTASDIIKEIPAAFLSLKNN